MAARTWNEKMDRLLVVCRDTFGRTADDPRGQITYTRTGFSSFDMTGIVRIDHNLRTADFGKYYYVELRLKDFDAAPFPASVFVYFKNPPNNTNTVTLDGVTYTFKSTINDATANEVYRGVDGEAAAANLTAALNRTLAGAGTQYTTATVAHPRCLGVHVTSGLPVGIVSACRVDYRTAGTSGNGALALESLHNASLSSTIFSGGGPLKKDIVTIDRQDYFVHEIGYDAEGLVTLQLEAKTTA
jgi:hypothetical protein